MKTKTTIPAKKIDGDDNRVLGVLVVEPKTKIDGDNVNSPPHYSFDIPCFEVEDVIHDRLVSIANLPRYSSAIALRIARPYANVLKYSLRAFHKNGIEDLKKARRELNQVIEQLEEYEKS